MSTTRQRDTPVELALRRALFQLGLRFRVNVSISGITRGRPDIVFPRQRVAIFVDGCFWHGCPDHGTLPNANGDWWQAKLARNIERDRRHEKELAEAGWRVFRVWEHGDVAKASVTIAKAVRG